MSIFNSVINNQNADIDRLICPNTIGASVDTLEPRPQGSIVWDIVTAQPYISDGVNWNVIDSNPAASNYTVIAPIVATDTDAIKIDNTFHTIAMEEADATHPGIITVGSQQFAGTKTFTNINTSSLNNPGGTITIGNSATGVNIGSGVATTNITVGTGITTTTMSGIVQCTNMDVAPDTTQNIGEHASIVNIAKPSGASTINFENSTLSGLGGMDISSAGGTSLVNGGTFPHPTIKGLSAGTGISVNDFGTSLEVVATGTEVSLSSTGSGVSLLYLGGPSLGPSMTIKSIEAGTNITVTDVSGSQLRIDSTSGGVTDVQSTGGSGSSLVNSSSAPTPLIKTVSAGTNMTVTDNGTYLTLDATANPPNLTNAGSGSQTFDNNGGGNYGIYSVAAGTGLSVSTSSSTISYSNTTTLTAGGGGQSLVIQGSPPAYQVYDLVAGIGITLTVSGNTIIISSP